VVSSVFELGRISKVDEGDDVRESTREDFAHFSVSKTVNELGSMAVQQNVQSFRILKTK